MCTSANAYIYGEELYVYYEGKKYSKTAQSTVNFRVDSKSTNTTNSETVIESAIITARGVVVDSNGYSIPGARIEVKGTNNGTVSDIDGNFSIRVQSNTQLEISFRGFKKQAVVAQPSMRIVLKK